MQTLLVKTALVASLAHTSMVVLASAENLHGHSDEWLADLEAKFA